MEMYLSASEAACDSAPKPMRHARFDTDRSGKLVGSEESPGSPGWVGTLEPFIRDLFQLIGLREKHRKIPYESWENLNGFL